MTNPLQVPLRAGMVGGGPRSNIGDTHRRALRLDGRFKLVSGVFVRDHQLSRTFARTLGIEDERAYPDFVTMARAEAARPDGIELAIVATPNAAHFDVAKAFLEQGIAVACEKPLTQDPASARELVSIASAHGVPLAVAHCYSAYAMVRQAARMVRTGELGEIRFVDVEHASGWASERLEDSGNPTVVWRMSPETGGFASAAADLGTHAFHLARFITGFEAAAISARVDTFVPGRKVADNMIAHVQWDNGSTGRIWASMAATGHHHGLRIRVFGAHASLEWIHEDPHHLTVRFANGETRVLAQGLSTLANDAQRVTRTGLGHPEGMLEAFANYYSDIADDLLRIRDGQAVKPSDLRYPTGVDGVAGVDMVTAVLESHEMNGVWASLPHYSEEKS